MHRVRLVDDTEMADWLEGFSGELSGEPGDFDWDEGNRTKNRKHGVEPEDVESLFASPFLFGGRIVEPVHAEDRWLVLGRDARGRCRALIFCVRGERLRPISCRPMRAREKTLFEELIDG